MEAKAASPDHLVLFFDRDDDLIDHVVSFVVDGLSRGDRVLVIMTPARIHRLDARLSHAAPDRQTGQLITLDVVDIVERIAPAGVFDSTVLVEVLTPFTVDGVPCRIYGEMASLLVERGHLQAAVALELAGQQFTHEGG